VLHASVAVVGRAAVGVAPAVGGSDLGLGGCGRDLVLVVDLDVVDQCCEIGDVHGLVGHGDSSLPAVSQRGVIARAAMAVVGEAAPAGAVSALGQGCELTAPSVIRWTT
jgi:hypothetical protein